MSLLLYVSYYKMELSIFLAKLFGLYLILEGLVLLFRQGFVRSVIADLMKSPALRYLCGILLLVAGLVMVVYHNIWEGSWVVVITILAWITLLKSAGYLFLGEKSMRKTLSAFDKKHWYVGVGIICILVGIYLARIGFGF